MKINEKRIAAAANFNPTKKSQTMSISELSKQIEDGTLTVPNYQRGLSWNEDKAVALFNYELFGKAPVAPLSFNSVGTNDEVPQLAFISREPLAKEDSQGVLSVVDGQQRLTTNYKAYADDPSFGNIVFDVTQANFKKINNAPKANQIPVGTLLNKDQDKMMQYVFDNATQTEAPKLIALLLSVRSKMLGYNYTVHIADNMTENEQIEWFEVLNNAGSRVSLIELTLSKLRMHDYDMYSEFISPYKAKVAEYGFEELFKPFATNVSYPIASMNPAFEVLFRNKKHNKNYAPIPSDTKETMFIKLTRDQLSEIGEMTLVALDKALNFVFEEQLSNYVTKMQHIMYLTGYFAFNDDAVDNEALVDWVKTVSFDNVSNGDKRTIFEALIDRNFELAMS